MTLTVNINGLEPISKAIDNLAKAMGGPGGVVATVRDLTDAAPTQPIQQVAPVHEVTPIPVAPLSQPIPTQQVGQPVAVSVPQTPPVQQAIPTTAVTYTADDLAKAAMTLMDSGKQNQLIALLQQFGVDALPGLPPEQYGAFATALRGMGAQI